MQGDIDLREIARADPRRHADLAGPLRRGQDHDRRRRQGSRLLPGHRLPLLRREAGARCSRWSTTRSLRILGAIDAAARTRTERSRTRSSRWRPRPRTSCSSTTPSSSCSPTSPRSSCPGSPSRAATASSPTTGAALGADLRAVPRRRPRRPCRREWCTRVFLAYLHPEDAPVSMTDGRGPCPRSRLRRPGARRAQSRRPNTTRR